MRYFKTLVFLLTITVVGTLSASAQTLKKRSNSFDASKLVSGQMLNQNRMDFLYEDAKNYHVFYYDNTPLRSRRSIVLNIDKSLNTIGGKTYNIPLDDYIGASYAKGKICVYNATNQAGKITLTQFVADKQTKQISTHELLTYSSKNKNCKYAYRFVKSDDGRKCLLLVKWTDATGNSPLHLFAFNADGTTLLKREAPATQHPYAALLDAKIGNDGQIDLLCKSYNDNWGSIRKRYKGCYSVAATTAPEALDSCSMELIRIKGDKVTNFKQDFGHNISAALLKQLQDGNTAYVAVLDEGAKPAKFLLGKLNEEMKHLWCTNHDFSERFNVKVKMVPMKVKLDADRFQYNAIVLNDLLELSDGTLAVAGIQNGNYTVGESAGLPFNYKLQFYGNFVSYFADKNGKSISCNFTDYAAVGSTNSDFMFYNDAQVTCNDFAVLPLSSATGIALVFNDNYSEGGKGFTTIEQSKDVCFKYTAINKNGQTSSVNLTGEGESGRVIRKFMNMGNNRLLLNTTSLKSGYFEVLEE